MNEFKCVVGLREATIGSGVGLFNRTLALRLGVPRRHLDEHEFADDDHPLFSLKFSELTVRQRRRMMQELISADRERSYSLFLHSLDHSSEERRIIDCAVKVVCGNDAIYRILKATHPEANLIRAFAPGNITEQQQAVCRPAAVNAFTFGMAGKIDRARLVRLQELVTAVGCDFRLCCSFSVHQTSDGTCLAKAVEFLSSCFGDMFVELGTLSDRGVAYFLNTCPVFVGFYADGVRANNTTFNTAVNFGRKIITNLDEFSPPEVLHSPAILNIDSAEPDDLLRFLEQDGSQTKRLAPLFSWERLVEVVAEQKDAEVDVLRIRAA